ncbi:hypothetical protein [Crocinitomix algicola]|uniref:hypothetical protein n=1 Tax=Crocinitomix algicola TaxID=1740263 RepID=UPI001FDF6B6A|nr:hypothetical protein [Crocinitomix algicola]
MKALSLHVDKLTTTEKWDAVIVRMEEVYLTAVKAMGIAEVAAVANYPYLIGWQI